MIYYMLFLSLMILAWFEVLNTSSIMTRYKTKKFYMGHYLIGTMETNALISGIVIFLILFAGLRWNVGLDFGTYQVGYETVRSGDLNISAEPSLVFLLYFAPNLTAVFLVYAFFSITYTVKYLKQNSVYFFVSLMLFFSNIFLRYDMGIMRQGLALAITLYSIKYAEKREFAKFIFFVFFAALFHSSAFMFLVVYFVVDKKFSLTTYFSLTVLSAIVGLTNIWKYLLKLISYLPIPMMEKYINHYMSGKYIDVTISFSDAKTALLLLIFVIYLSKCNDSSFKAKYRALVNIYFLGTCVSYAFKSFLTLSDRGADYFCIVEILLLPAILKQMNSKGIRTILMVLICAYAFRNVYYYSNYVSTSWMNAAYLPYTTVFH